MGRFSDYFRGRNNDEQNERGASLQNDDYEYYEDTHDLGGNYTDRLRSFQRENTTRGFEGSFSERNDFAPEQRAYSSSQRRMEVPQTEPLTGKNSYSNFMVYEPRTADDVQTLIDFLKTKESAIINLDNVEEDVSQRVLDFVSGAIYALNGSVHRIAGNIFLLSPEGVGITNNSYERDEDEK